MLLRDYQFLMLFLACISFACERFRNDAESLALDCGISASSVGEGRYLKILDPEGQELTPGSFLVNFQDKAQNRWRSLPITARNCVLLPEEGGLVNVSRQNPRSGVQYEHVPSLWSDRRPRLKLVDSPKVKVSLSCGSGLFASTHLQQPFQFEVQGKLNPVTLRIYVVDQRTQQETTLWTKPWGRPNLDLPEQLMLDALAEGPYKLRASIEDPGDGLDVGPRPLVANQSCDLIVMRTQPLLSEGSWPRSLPVLNPGEALPWQPAEARDTLWSCQEAHVDVTDNASQVCRPSANCLDAKVFQAVRTISTSEPGIYDFYFYAQDPAGNRSPLQCQTVVVSQEAPSLELRWKKQSWNSDQGEVMELPYARVDAEVLLQHPLLSNAALQRSLQCKVEFLLQGRDVLRGDKVTCLSGPCAGKSMGDFVDCDQSVSFSIHKAWEQKGLKTSQLRLTARVDDGAGNSRSASIGVWLNTTRWPLEEHDYGSGIDTFTATGQRLHEDKKGQQLILIPESTVFKLSGDVWQPTKVKDHPELQLQQIIRSKSGLIHGIVGERLSPTHGGIKPSGFARWDGDVWELIDMRTPSGEKFTCLRLWATHYGEALCSIASAAGDARPDLALLKDGQWQLLSTHEGPASPDFNFEPLFFQDSQARIWCYWQNSIFMRPFSGSWQKMAFAMNGTILEDRHAQVWLVSQKQWGPEYFLFRFNGVDFVSAMVPTITQPLRDDFYINPTGDLAIGSSFWNTSQQSWQELPRPLELAQDADNFYPLYDNRGKLWWFDIYGIFGELNGRSVWLPLNVYGLSCYDEGSPCDITITGQNSLLLRALRPQDFSLRTYSFRSGNLSYFDLEGLGLPSTKDISGFWPLAESGFEFHFSYFDSFLYRWQGGRFKASSGRKVPVGCQARRAPDGAVFCQDGTSLLRSRDDAVWQAIYTLPEPYSAAIRFVDFKDTLLIRSGEETLLFERNQALQSLKAPTHKFLLSRREALWGINEQGLSQYADLDFTPRRQISFDELKFTLTNILDAQLVSENLMLFNLQGEMGSYYVLVDLTTLKHRDLAPPGSNNFSIVGMEELDSTQLLIVTNLGVHLYRDGLWSDLVTKEQLLAMGLSAQFVTLYQDSFQRVWFHMSGTFGRFDYGRPSVNFR